MLNSKLKFQLLSKQCTQVGENLIFLIMQHENELEIGLYFKNELVAEIIAQDHDENNNPLYIMQIIKKHVDLFDLSKLAFMKKHINSYNEFSSEYVDTAKLALKDAFIV